MTAKTGAARAKGMIARGMLVPGTAPLPKAVIAAGARIGFPPTRT